MSLIISKGRDPVDYMALVRKYFDLIGDIKEAIANEDWYTAKHALFDIPEEDRSALWKAPRDGGVFTTYERSCITNIGSLCLN